MPAPRPTLSFAQLRADLHASVFRAGGADLVGFEVELIPLALSGDRVDLDATRTRAEALWADLAGPDLETGRPWRGGTLTREPGGQVEYSGPALASPEAAARLASGTVRRLGARARRRGLDLMAVGLHPWASAEEIGLRTTAPRYRAMQAYFDSIGPFGRRMMRQTGSVQVAVDFGTGPEVRQRWELAQRLAPVVTAAFAHSPVLQGQPAPWSSLRAETWLRLDPSRTGLPPRFLADPEADPAEQYLDFARNAPVMFVVQPDGSYRPLTHPVPFQTWMTQGLETGYPTLDDWHTHLSTLFPDIRPRGYLEVRALDAPGLAWVGVPILLLGHALREPAARLGLLDRLRPHHDDLPNLRERAARLGLADPVLKELALALVEAVRPHLIGPAEAIVEAYAERYIRLGRTPADELRDLIQPGGSLDPTDFLRLEHENDGEKRFHRRERGEEDREKDGEKRIHRRERGDHREQSECRMLASEQAET